MPDKKTNDADKQASDNIDQCELGLGGPAIRSQAGLFKRLTIEWT